MSGKEVGAVIAGGAQAKADIAADVAAVQRVEGEIIEVLMIEST